jgi:hypothetical protein
MRLVFNQMKKGLPSFCEAFMKSSAFGDDLRRVEVLHPLLGERPGILNRLLAHASETRVFRRIILGRGQRVEHPARAEPAHERFLATGELPGERLIIPIFRLFLRVEVVQAPEELVEPVRGRQVFVAVAEVVLAKVSGAVPSLLEHFPRHGDADCSPSLSPGTPTVTIPERIGYWPVMNEARPAVQEFCA